MAHGLTGWVPHRHHRGMATAIDDCPVRVLVSLKRGWRSPLEAYTLRLA